MGLNNHDFCHFAFIIHHIYYMNGFTLLAPNNHLFIYEGDKKAVKLAMQRTLFHLAIQLIVGTVV